jgi:hypothetical protein
VPLPGSFIAPRAARNTRGHRFSAYNVPVLASLRRSPAAAFAFTALTIAAVCVGVLRSRLFAINPDMAAWGVTFDLTITIPLLYWSFVVRTGRAGAITIIPLFLLMVGVTHFLIPRPEQQFARDLSRFAVPFAEVLLLTLLARRILAARKEGDPSADPADRIRIAASAIFGPTPVAAIVASEITLLYYALAGWKLKPPVPPAPAITFHQRSGWGTVLAAILLLIAAEGIGMHLLLAMWSPVAAWGWTALDLWAALWLLGDYHALRLRPSWVDRHGLHLRFGMRWTLLVPHEQVASIETIRSEEQWKRKDVLKVAILESPSTLITLREPLTANGLAGLRKTVRAIALLPDQEQALRDLQPAR